MIKSLFDETEEKDRDKIEEIKQFETEIEDKFLSVGQDFSEINSVNVGETNNLIEMSPVENFVNEQEAEIFPTENNVSPDVNNAPPKLNFTLSNSFEPTAIESPTKKNDEFNLFQMQSKPESTAETARKSGLAMSAAIALFGSVVFLLIIGWFTDLLLGTSPWGIICGIVLGSIVGFFQFFRMTSQILKNND